MIRHSPAENYFKYLVIHPECYTDGHIKDVAIELGLDYIGDWYIQWLRHRMRPPVPFYPEDQCHAKSYQYLLRESLVQAFLPGKSMEKANRILSRPRWRELVETLLIAQAPFEAVVHALRVRHRFIADADAIRLYRFFYWNIDLLDSTQLRSLLELRYTGGFHSSGEDREMLAQFPALSKNRHNDPRVIAARLPASPISSVIAQLGLGVMPKRLNLENVVQATMITSTLKTLEGTIMGGQNGAQISQGYGAVAETMSRLKEAVVNPETNLREDLKRITVATTPNVVPTLRQLTAGNHTVNVQPDPKPEEDILDDLDEEDVIEGVDASEFEGMDPADATGD
jgi:hypothetical protein